MGGVINSFFRVPNAMANNTGGQRMILPLEAEEIITKAVPDFGIETVSLEQAQGRILRESIEADREYPPFDKVCMDGIAFSYSEWKEGLRKFPIRGVQAAGEPQKSLLSSTDCFEVMTGAPIPKGCDTVVRIEDVKIVDQEAKLEENLIVKQGKNVHPRGSDFKKGAALLQPGVALNGAMIAILASQGYAMVKVAKTPRVALISTGNELVDIESEPLPHQIRRSNAYGIQAELQAHGLSRVTVNHLPDNEEELRRSFSELLDRNDVLIITGGVSKGKFDYVPGVLESLNVRKAFHRIKQRPGKPMWFGTGSAGQLVFGLPGNPVSAMICFRRYVLPGLCNSGGVSLGKRAFPVHPAEEVHFQPSLQYFLPCRLLSRSDGSMQAIPVSPNGSGDFASLGTTDGFIELNWQQNLFTTEDVVPFYPWRNLW